MDSKHTFLTQRRSGIGGSDVATILAWAFPKLALKPFKTPLELYYQKILEPEEVPPSIPQQRGINLEPVVRDLYATKTGYQVVDHPNFVRSTKYPFMIAHPDAYCLKPDGIKIILECKTVHALKADQWKNEPPMEYYLQAVHYSIVCDMPPADIAAAIGLEGFSGHKDYFKHYTCFFNDDLKKRIIDAEEAFWETHVLKKQPPEPITLSDTKLKFPNSNKKSKVANPEILALAQKEAKLYTQTKILEKEMKQCSVQLADYLEDNYSLVTEDGKTIGTFGNSMRKKVDYKKLEQLCPQEIYEQVVSQSNCRSLRLNRKF